MIGAFQVLTAYHISNPMQRAVCEVIARYQRERAANLRQEARELQYKDVWSRGDYRLADQCVRDAEALERDAAFIEDALARGPGEAAAAEPAQ